MNFSKIIPCLALVIASFFATAQETIDVQRPTLTESNTTIAKGVIQFENGTQFDINSNTMGYSVFARFGTTEKLEFRLASDLMSPQFDLSGKVLLFKRKNNIPGLATTLAVNPWSGITDWRLSATNGIGEKLFYTLNLGNNHDWYGIALLGISIGNNGAFFGEYQYHELGISTINSGATYIIKNEVQLDAHWGLNADASGSYPYVGAGISFRVK